MEPATHLAVAGAISAASVLFIGVGNAAALFTVSALLDIDHFAYYAVHRGDFNPVRAIQFFRARLDVSRHALCVLHSVEFLAFFGAVALLGTSQLLMACLAGVVVHLAVDLWQGIHMRRLSYRWWSIVEYVIQAGKAR